MFPCCHRISAPFPQRFFSWVWDERKNIQRRHSLRIHTFVSTEREVWWSGAAVRLSAVETLDRVAEETWTDIIPAVTGLYADGSILQSVCSGNINEMSKSETDVSYRAVSYIRQF